MLSVTAVRTAKPKEKTYTMSDIRGLYLEVSTTGIKYWKFRYTRDGARNWHTIGEWPVVSLDEAREIAQMLRSRIESGLSLIEQELEAERTIILFKTVAAEWADFNDTRPIVESSKKKDRSCLNRYVLPYLGEIDITQIGPPEVLAVLQRLASLDKYWTVTQTKAIISHIFKFAAAKGIVTYDPCSMLKGVIVPPPVQHFRSIRTPTALGKLLRAINSIEVRRTRLAMTFLIYAMCRPGEMRAAEWGEIDIDRCEWRIPAEKMKKRKPHIVPLSDQLLAIIEAMRSVSGESRYVFASPIDPSRPIDAESIRKVIEKIGYKGEVTPHGFRSTASTLLNEHGFNRDHIERQLAHIDASSVRATYNYADYLKERRKMVQWYANYLDKLRGEPIDLS